MEVFTKDSTNEWKLQKNVVLPAWIEIGIFNGICN